MLFIIRDFYDGWRAESNPWRETWRDSNSSIELYIPYLGLFLFLSLLGQGLGRRFGPSSPLGTRPTVLASTVHAAITSAISIYLLVAMPSKSHDTTDNADDSSTCSDKFMDWTLWQNFVIPLSISYFIIDTFFYCLPRGDSLIFFHHVIMCCCHYPVSSNVGAQMAGCGNVHWILWLSTIGYTSEVSTVLMNYRWYLLQTLKEHWVGFAVLNLLIVLSWVYRVVLFAYLLSWEILPRTTLYMEKKQLLTYVIMVMGHAVIGLLSIYWLKTMCRGGIMNLLTFQKKKEAPDSAASSTSNGKSNGKIVSSSSSAGFSFGDDIGR